MDTGMVSGEYRAYTGVPGGYRNPPGRLMGLLGPSEEEEGRPRAAVRPLPPSPNWTRRGAAPPFPFPLSLLPSPLLLPLGRGSPIPGGIRTPHGARLGWLAPSPSSTPLYTGREAPLGYKTIDLLDLLAVCGAPLHHNQPREYRSGA